MSDTGPDLSVLKDIDWDALGKLIAANETSFTKVLQERFPAFAWATEIPELKDLLDRAVSEEWEPTTFEANFRDTTWYSTRTETQRQFDIQEQTDPATVAESIADTQEAIRQQASRLFGEGKVDDATIADLARRSLRSGLSEAELSGALLDSARNIEAGEYTAAQTSLRALGRQYMAPLSQEETDSWTRRIMTGELSTEGVSSLLRERSKSRFPALGDLIDQGVSLTDYFGDHQRTVASMMGMGVNEVDLVNDKRWAPILGFADDRGSLRPMTAAETQQYVRTTNDYYRTPSGKAEAAGIKRNLAAAMGAT